MADDLRTKSDNSGRVIKYKPRFPNSRIKKILQADEEVGRVAQGTPITISRAVEMFLEKLVLAAVAETEEGDGTVTALNLKRAINAEPKFDYLKEIVAGVSEQTQEPKGQGGKKRKRESVSKPRATKPKKSAQPQASDSSDKPFKSDPSTSDSQLPSTSSSLPTMTTTTTATNPALSLFDPNIDAAMEVELKNNSAPIVMSTTQNDDDSDDDYD